MLEEVEKDLVHVLEKITFKQDEENKQDNDVTLLEA